MISLFLNLSVDTAQVDEMGHLGGLLTGMILSCYCIEEKKDPAGGAKPKTKLQMFGLYGGIAWFVGMLTIFYTLRQPVKV